MECAEVREQLSGFIDGALNTKKMGLVEEHLKRCKDCRAVFNSLRVMVGELGSLNKLKAPDDFLDLLHERMKSESRFRNFARFFFSPVRIKVPLELAGVAVTAILVFSIFSIQHENEKIMLIPKENVEKRQVPSSVISEKRTTAENDIVKKKEGFISAEKRPEEPLREREAFTSKRPAEKGPEEGKTIRKVDQPGKAVDAEKISPDPGLKRTVPGQEKLSLKSSAETEGTGPTASGSSDESIKVIVLVEKSSAESAIPVAPSTFGIKQEEGRERPSRAGDMEALVPLSPPHEVKGKVSDLNQGFEGKEIFSEETPVVSKMEETSERVRELVMTHEGRILEIYYDTAGRNITIDALMPVRNYKTFCERLSTLAEMENPCPFASKEGVSGINIQIRIMKRNGP